MSSPVEQLKKLLPQCLLPDQVRIGQRLARALAPSRGGPTADLPLDRWLAEAHASIDLRKTRGALQRRVTYPLELPITARQRDIVAAIRQHQVVIVAGETGSGKTTQLPKMCLDAGLGQRARIGCTQPRRVAATSISRRVAEELDVEWGHEVGCKIRFSDHSRPETSVKFMTDGILLAEIQGDPLLAEYEAIILDEAHERSLNIDFLLGYLLTLLARRDDLKLLITSATIDTERFARAFGGAPVIEVSGRMFPVEVRYSPLDEHAEEEGDVTYIDAAANVIADLLGEATSGDILVFMPGERDIRETCDLLNARHEGWLEVVPLFGRLSAAEQHRIFAPGPRRRVVVATNIAETSLTVPRIRYVVDAGLARINRYHPGTRSNRLPIEPISQSSANQRKGRCGRVADGICVRLYSEDDFKARRPYTEPEIQRSDLADVILRMMAHCLGEIETFPFIDPPSPAAISSAYELLQELGALDEQRVLTPLGRDLARLPVDPAIGRMILEAHREDALADVLVIAAGLSIQDPRERPLEKRETADAAHRRFQHAQSDFLTLLNIWRAYHDQWESLKTQNQLRRFCKAHFLSFLRMREWVDIHAQLEEAVEDLQSSKFKVQGSKSEGSSQQPQMRSAFTQEYAAVHRSILTGLFGHLARREDKNLYRLGGNKQAMVFPGSGLFEKTPERGAKRESAAGKPPPSQERRHAQPAWLIAGELLETSRLFLRMVAALDPEWVIELAPHLVKITHENPHWDAETGRVLCTEKFLLRGLVLREGRVGYLKVNTAEATEIFIRAALVEEGITERAEVHPLSPAAGAARGSLSRSGRNTEDAPENPRVVKARNVAAAETAARRLVGKRPTESVSNASYRFLEHNHQLREKVEMWQTRLPHRVVPDLDEALFQFYAKHLHECGSTHDLNRLIKSQHEPDFLCATDADLLGEHAASFDRGTFPDTVTVDGQSVSIAYAYAPGEERDGVTVRLTVPLAEAIDPQQLDWAVPALREERVMQLLQRLPKDLRRALMPLNHTAREIVRAVDPQGRSFLAAMSVFVKQRYGFDIPPAAWPVNDLPPHLRPRFEIVGKTRQALAAGRDLKEVRERVRQIEPPDAAPDWQRAARQWDRYDVKSWDFGELPERILVSEAAGFPIYAYPALHVEHSDINRRLFRKPEEAAQAAREAVPRLAERVLHREMGWLQKDLRALNKFAVLHATLGPIEELPETAFENLCRHVLPEPDPPIRTAAAFEPYVERARQALRGLVPRLADLVGAILQKRQDALVCRRPLPNMRAEIDALVPPRFLRAIPFAQLAHVSRYLQALVVRAERAALNPGKDADKAARVKPHADALRALLAQPIPDPERRERVERFRWLVEEFKVSVFAQELGTAVPVSAKKLEELLAEIRQP
ncbi:MAG: ATP-dependent RNA helicase HrpA [Verrucomicrobia bacterium]|nr:ATP-dependent RNA helicase HrpA [Verrucomicrobiota bacterium]